MQIESNDAHENNLDSALPDYMWDKKAKEQFKRQKNRRNEIDENEKHVKIEENKKEEFHKNEEYF